MSAHIQKKRKSITQELINEIERAAYRSLGTSKSSMQDLTLYEEVQGHIEEHLQDPLDDSQFLSINLENFFADVDRSLHAKGLAFDSLFLTSVNYMEDALEKYDTENSTHILRAFEQKMRMSDDFQLSSDPTKSAVVGRTNFPHSRNPALRAAANSPSKKTSSYLSPDNVALYNQKLSSQDTYSSPNDGNVYDRLDQGRTSNQPTQESNYDKLGGYQKKEEGYYSHLAEKGAAGKGSEAKTYDYPSTEADPDYEAMLDPDYEQMNAPVYEEMRPVLPLRNSSQSGMKANPLYQSSDDAHGRVENAIYESATGQGNKRSKSPEGTVPMRANPLYVSSSESLGAAMKSQKLDQAQQKSKGHRAKGKGVIDKLKVHFKLSSNKKAANQKRDAGPRDRAA